MGWGCYRHEWDEHSESWNEYVHANEKRLPGRAMSACPKCYVELLDQIDRLKAGLLKVRNLAAYYAVSSYDKAAVAEADALLAEGDE